MSYEVLKDRNVSVKEEAIIPAHNCQRSGTSGIAYFLDFCDQPSETDAKYILFCGVDFMAETASILNPDKKVLILDATGNLSMRAVGKNFRKKVSKE